MAILPIHRAPGGGKQSHSSTFRGSKLYAAARRQKTCFESRYRGLVFLGPSIQQDIPERTVASFEYLRGKPPL